MILKVFLAMLFLLGLLYLIWPGPSSIENIKALPDSTKSDEPGDTVQIPELVAYFSQLTRNSVTDYYFNEFSYMNVFGFKIPPLRFNYPVEDSQTRVREQVKTTYLEEFAYPFRDSLYVNGYDKVTWNELNHIKTDELNKNIEINGETFNSKTTLRYYGSSIFWRVVIYVGFWVILTALAKIFYKAIKKY